MHIVTILRYYLGLTQMKLAEQAGVSFADLNEIENGQVYFRRKMGISQIEAANIMDIPTPSLCAYENGDRQCPVTVYQKLAKFYGVKIDDLLEDYPTKNTG